MVATRPADDVNGHDWRAQVRNLPMSTPLLIAVDLDGTLLQSDGTLASTTIEEARRAVAQNVRLVPCSARAPHSIDAALAGMADGDICIASNGAIVWNRRTNATLWQAVVTSAQIGRVLDSARRRFRSIHFGWEDQSELHLERDLAEMFDLRVSEDNAYRIVLDDTALPGKDVIKMHLSADDASADEVKAWMSVTFPELSAVRNGNAAGQWVEVLGANADKGTALQRVVSRYRPLPLVFAVGDGVNDLPLRKATAWFFAMDNAAPTVKDCAVEVLSTNDEDGIGRWLHELVALRQTRH